MSKKNNNDAVLRVGATLQMGKYRIEGVLGHGGFGITYRARHTMLGTECCIKEFFMRDYNMRDSDGQAVSVVTASTTVDPRGQFLAHKAKFIKEAKRQAKLNNPHVVKVLDVWEENGTAYFAMDLVEGEPLSTLRDRRPKGRFDEDFVRDVLGQMLDVLEYVHGEGLWHLDIKPGNVMLSRDGVVKLIDFGASKSVSVDEGGSPSTSKLVHTPGYAAPEQMNQNLAEYGPWTDLFLLGTTLYNLLTGLTPPDPYKIYDYGDDAFAFGDDVSQGMRRLVIALMQPNRNKRPRSVAEVRALLDASIDDEEDDADETTQLGGGKPVAEVVVVADEQDGKKDDKKAKRGWMKYAAAAAVVLLGGWGIASMMGGGDGYDGAAEAGEEVTAGPAIDEAEKMSYTSDGVTYVYTGRVEDGVPDTEGEVATVSLSDGRIYTGTIIGGHLTDANGRMEIPADGESPASVFVGEVKNGVLVKGRRTVTAGSDKGTYFEGTFKANGEPLRGTWYDAAGVFLANVP